MGKKMTVTRNGNTIAEKRPDLLEVWDWERNAELGLDPSVLTCGSKKKAWWVCATHGTSWQTAIYTKASGSGCEQCKKEAISRARSMVSPGNSLAERYPDIAAQWDHKLNDKAPDKVAAHARESAHWYCEKHDYSWTAAIYSRTSKGSSGGCPKCGIESRSLNRMVPKKGRSLVDMFPEASMEWDYESNMGHTPSDVSYGSNYSATWKCSICKRVTWEAPVSQRTSGGTFSLGCPECKTKIVGAANSKPKSDGTFLVDSDPEIASEFDAELNVGLDINSISTRSNKYVYWRCRFGHTYGNTVKHRTSRGDGCPECNKKSGVSFPEKAMFYYIKLAFPDAEENSKPDIDALGKKSFDVWIPSMGVAVEYDGRNWHNVCRDSEKDTLCSRHGIRIIRIREPGCPTYDTDATIVDRKTVYGHESLSESIEKVLLLLGSYADVNVGRDRATIMRAMNLSAGNSSIVATHPSVAEAWNEELNGGLLPEMFSHGSHEKVWLNCQNGHEPHQSSISNACRSEYLACPACANRGRSHYRRSLCSPPGTQLELNLPA